VVEQLFCKQQVVSSNLTVGSKKTFKRIHLMLEDDKKLQADSVDAFEFIGKIAKTRKKQVEKTKDLSKEVGQKKSDTDLQ
jgi:hypothetical protein